MTKALDDLVERILEKKRKQSQAVNTGIDAGHELFKTKLWPAMEEAMILLPARASISESLHLPIAAVLLFAHVMAMFYTVFQNVTEEEPEETLRPFLEQAVHIYMEQCKKAGNLAEMVDLIEKEVGQEEFNRIVHEYRAERINKMGRKPNGNSATD